MLAPRPELRAALLNPRRLGTAWGWVGLTNISHCLWPGFEEAFVTAQRVLRRLARQPWKRVWKRVTVPCSGNGVCPAELALAGIQMGNGWPRRLHRPPFSGSPCQFRPLRLHSPPTCSAQRRRCFPVTGERIKAHIVLSPQTLPFSAFLPVRGPWTASVWFLVILFGE